MAEVEVSVGIPAYHNETTIGETIRSLREQTFEEWECFVSCDADSTKTYEAALEAVDGDTRFVIATSGVRLGVAGNWNHVLARATAPLFKLLCADDVLFADSLEAQVATLAANSSAVLCTGRRDIVDVKGRIIKRGRGLSSEGDCLSLEDVIGIILRRGTNVFGEPSFALFRTEILRRSGGFSSDWQYTIDLASYVEVLRMGDLVALDRAVGAFRVSASSLSTALVSQQSRELVRFLDETLAQSTLDFSRTNLVIGHSRIRAVSAARRLVMRMIALRNRGH